ncbi:MAG: pilQ 2 [Gammaproteobacteria bacterium]|nr:pilQ 2 [Gammaproteobacteria bacterium]
MLWQYPLKRFSVRAGVFSFSFLTSVAIAASNDAPATSSGATSSAVPVTAQAAQAKPLITPSSVATAAKLQPSPAQAAASHSSAASSSVMPNTGHDASTTSAKIQPVAAPAEDTQQIKVKSGLLSFNFQNIGVKELLQLLAKNSGNNFVISDSVKGNMSLSLQNVTWQKALNVVMRANGLDSRQFDNVMIIAPIDELANNDVKRLQAAQQLANLAPPVSAMIPLHYANANDLATVLKGQQNTLLSPNGQVTVDPRTNTLLVRDVQASVDKVRDFIRKLDIPAKQVLIEARIVSVDTEYVKELGVRWGVSNTHSLSGTLEGANTLRKGTPLAEVPIKERLNFNLPATPSGFLGQPSSLGLALIRLNKTYLDLELSALEGEQRAQIISNPRVITSNLQKATIQTGEDIPYQEATSSGATNVAFKKAVLGLDITPQITSDNSIVLNLKVTQNKRGAETNGVPAIDTQEVQSNVLMNNDETIVIGGVYKQIKGKTVVRIPFLGDLPVVGALFRHTNENTKRSELLIFVTPKIVDQTKAMTLSSNEQRLNQMSLEVDKGVNLSGPIKEDH